VGGQKTLRAYWKNYFEQTDGVVWVVDSTDRERLYDCAVELHQLLQEEVHFLVVMELIEAFDGCFLVDIGE
jgi:GTPase SAR1 family protein